MSNKYIDHLQVLVEDDANRQLINGLNKHISLQFRRLQVLRPAGGWMCVLNAMSEQGRIEGMSKYDRRHLLLLIDFDDRFCERWKIYEERKARLVPAIADRIYLLGCLHEPERLKAACSYKAFEELGLELADDCVTPHARSPWKHEHLRHNATELKRLRANVKPFLFAI